ncbi:MAG: hypothetical protein U0414_38970 [Polyangiaceae bacterium]
MIPYRTAGALDPGDPTQRPRLPTIDVSGGPGRNGAHGASGYPGPGSGGHGGNGSDAGPASQGVSSGHIDVTIAARGEAEVSIVGVVTLANGVANGCEERFNTHHDGSVQLIARGGRGGHGGRGGQGGDGARGYRGTDATRYSSGSDGGPGGDGGAGGDGSSGAPGGSGGRVTVSVDEAETHLLMLVTHAVEGGPGGHAGANGAGGSGGPGGSGGSGHSWTTTEHYHDSQGRSHTRTHHHRRAGGSDGPPGRGGPSGSARLFHGAAGRDGAFRIIVESAAGAVRYKSRYDLVLVGFVFDNDNADGVFEPDEHVTISRIVVQNVGGMPTPLRAPVIYLRPSSWILPDERTLVLPRPLAPGESIELDGQLGFHIAHHAPSGPSDPLASDAAIELGAWIPAANRTFGDFATRVPREQCAFKVTFPATLSRIEGAFSLAAGERARVAFRVQNVSKLALGADSTTRRVLSFWLRLHNSVIASERITFRDADGAEVSLDEGLRGTLDRLGPGAERVVEGTLEFASSATSYEAARLWVTLGLGRLQLVEDARDVQVQELVVRVAERYRPNSRAAALLVVENRTTRQELDGWRAAAAALGVEIATWDLSLEGHLDLGANVAGGALAAQFAGKAILILDAPYDTRAGERRAHAALDPADARAFAERGGALALIGAPESAVSGATALPISSDPLAEHAGLDGAIEIVSGLPAWGGARFVIETRHVFFASTEADLQRRAERLARTLDRTLPGRRHVVVHRFSGDVLDPGLIKRTRLGLIDVHRTLDLPARPSSRVAAADADVHDGPLVESRIGPLALAFHLPLAERLAVLRTKLPRSVPLLLAAAEGPSRDAGDDPPDAIAASVDRPVHEPFGYLPMDSRDEAPAEAWLRWSVASDLVSEIGAWIARPRVVAAGGDESRDDALPALSAVAALDLTGTAAIDPHSPLAAFILETVALVRAVAWNHVSTLEVIPPLLWLRKRPRLYFRVRALADRLFERAFPGGDADAGARRSAAKRELSRAFVRLENLEREAGARGAEALPHLLRDPLGPLGLVVDDEHAASPVLAG